MAKYNLSLVFALGLAVLPAFAQLDTNSITVSANHSTTVQPDQVVFGVYVDTNMDVGLTDVLAAVQGAGLTQANFSGVATTQSYGIYDPSSPAIPAPKLEWAFALPVAISRLKETVSTLTNLQKSIVQANSGMTLSFQVQGTQVSPQLQQSQSCSIPDLLADARAQAQKIASAAQMILGDVLAMSSGTTTNVGAVTTGYISVARLGVSSSSTYLPPVCSLTVKFGMSKY
jgi:hypothetical protein